MVEQWKPINGYKNYYEVSNFGRVKSVYRKIVRSNGYNQTFKERILKQRLSTGGYNIVTLCMDGKCTTKTVHRLVANCFLNPKPGLDVNHIDGDKTNNHIDNLECISRSENMIHAFNIGLCNLKGENHSQAKITNDIVLEIRERSKDFDNIVELSKLYPDLRYTHVYDIVKRRSWKHI